MCDERVRVDDERVRVDDERVRVRVVTSECVCVWMTSDERVRVVTSECVCVWMTSASACACG